ncbi:hypothetical protein [Variovorax sp. JS1663]|uniref:hypothetical protein n=1 Tax=Variovorax sp. JS1663 TaxID=1851577 RepID=UPI00130250FC|nr:hypothetical protein [Variovorax sp. JS1663]
MKTRSTTGLQAAAFIFATLAATCLLVAAGLGEEPQPAGATASAVIAHHESP